MSALMAVLLIGGCASEKPGDARALVYGSPYQPNTLNPITAPDIVSRSAIELIFDGLVSVDDHLEIHGNLASSWESSPDGRELVFHLREGVRWHDGAPFSAEDVKFTYDTIIDPRVVPTVSKSDFSAIEAVEAMDPLTVRFRLSRPDASLLSKLTVGVAPRHLLQGQDLASSAFNTRPVGTGPFRFESWAKGDSLIVSRNPSYHGSVAGLDRIVWKVVPDSSLLALQVANGEVDAAPILNPRDGAAIGAGGKTKLYETLEGDTQISLQMNNPLFSDIRVRRALAYGIDVEALISKVMLGAALPATSDILPGTWAHDPGVPRYGYDPALARALLAEAGWSPGADGVLVKDGRRFEFTLMTDSGHKVREQVMEVVRQHWADLGMEVKTALQERNSFVAQRVLKGDFEAVLLQSSVQVDPDLSRRFHSRSIGVGQNFLNYRNSELDRLLDAGLATSDRETRTAAYRESQRILAEEVPQIPLFHPRVQYAFNSRIDGVAPSPINLFWNAEDWRWR